jgi:DNA-binding response OmpR family regulator
MTINPVTPKSFQFGSYTLDVARGYQRTAAHDFDLRPKCFEVPCHLVENANRLVSKGELIKTVRRM